MSTAGPSDLFGDTAPDRSEALIEALVEDFHDRLRRGENPDLYSYQEAYPHLAVPLEERLLAVERLHELAAYPTGPSPAEEPSAEPLPSSLGRYELRRVLGRGATAIVYEAYDTQLRRPVALKVLRTDLTDSPNIVRRFTRDARLAARLRHSHIVPMHVAGIADGRPYIDMELVDGVSLEQHLQNRPGRPWDARAAAQLISKMALALAHAHRQGILHRDVKPSNILIDSHGEPQLTDFGLARELAGATALTALGDILGTPAYMSPEQASGQAHRADARSDVYSLGVIFYRLLTGRLPFPNVMPLELLACTARGDVPPIRRSNPVVPRDLETICLRALEREADDRFRTAQELSSPLRSIVIAICTNRIRRLG
jgi:serine/threonine-protein kinase